ncbi:MAG: DinB family protein [Candidatus Eisenbacteria bacterium]|nr:DinB family protein [Candidatus Eisenbacteria bacterium]
MPATEHRFLKTASRCRSKEVALQLGMLDDMTRRLFEEDLEKITKNELIWQSAPGNNTIGMLLAHLAVVETYWTQIGVDRVQVADSLAVIGIEMDDDGLPLPEGGLPPAGLKSKTLDWYRDLLEKSRKYVNGRWGRLTDADLKKRLTRIRKNGDRVITDPRWVLYHVIEHFAVHQGQILLIRHQYRDARAGR